MENGIVALLISAEHTRSSRVDGEKEKTNRLSESSRGESGEDSEETTDGTSEDGGATSEDGDHVTSLSEEDDDTDVPRNAASTGGHSVRRRKDQSIVVSVLTSAGPHTRPQRYRKYFPRRVRPCRRRVRCALAWEASRIQMTFLD